MTGTISPDPRARLVATLALAVATLGVAIPYGTASGGSNLHLNLLEWVLSALALLAGLGLVADLVPHLNPGAHARGLAFMTAGFVWTAIAAYDALVPGDLTLWWRLGHAIPDVGWAIIGLTAWRIIATDARAAKATGVTA